MRVFAYFRQAKVDHIVPCHAGYSCRVVSSFRCAASCQEPVVLRLAHRYERLKLSRALPEAYANLAAADVEVGQISPDISWLRLEDFPVTPTFETAGFRQLETDGGS